ncbi:SIR2 family protein [Aliarcobacter thereius]|uniref:SIR2 family protein n=1 Tax=Aliarcobacter thereius TaxID=544718 RepID=UPI0014859568|nr:SIR2 family protein [Aliarcobacter thereius]
MEEELKKLLQNNKVIPFVGAGVSLAVKSKGSDNNLFLGWKQLLEFFANELEKYDKFDEANFVRLSLKLKKNNYLEIADEIKNFFPSDQIFFDCIEKAFNKQSNEAELSSLDLAKSIWGLNQKLIITTNYDKVLHWSSPSPNDTRRWDIQAITEQVSALSNNILHDTIWHLHGHIENKHNLILTSKSYNNLYEEEKFGVAKRVLSHYLATKSFLFIGYSLEDSFFVNTIKKIFVSFEGLSQTHYILLERNKTLPDDLNKIIIPIYYEEKGDKLIQKINELSPKYYTTGHQLNKSTETSINLLQHKIKDLIPLCNNNLPIEDYNLDGGFVGREEEIKKVKNLIYSNEDRIITITGAGGLGKTSTALKCAYSFLEDINNPFKNIIWFSAKEDKLTSDNGIVQIESQISDYALLLKNILRILDASTSMTFEKNSIEEKIYKDSIYKIFLQTRSLLIIDNLETISNQDIIDFIKDIPRPSQVLITSRKGLGEIERRHPLLDFSIEDSIELFKLIAKERNRMDLYNLSAKTIEKKVKSVRSYPLLIKWSIGKICLGMDIDKAFNEIYSGESEISQFVFNDIFNLISENSKKCLFSMIILGDKPISKYLIQHVSNLNHNEIEDSIKELIITSFIYSEVKEEIEEDESTNTYYSMLSLTRGFIKFQLDSKTVLKNELISTYRNLSLQIEKSQKSKDSFENSLLEFGIKTEEDKIAFNYVKAAKNYLNIGNEAKAKESFDKAISISPELSYVLSEYGKFESSIGHNFEAEKYHLKACQIDDKNFNTHFAYGVFLRKQNNIETAIIHLKKAKKLNPRYLPIYNELGRALSFNGQYEEANKNFIISLAQKDEFINYKHLNITLHYKSDNYKRWAQELFLRKDYEKGKEKLFRSFEIIEKANKEYKFDLKNQELEKRISQDIGKIMLTLNEYDIGKEYLLKSTKYIENSKKNTELSFGSFIILINHILNKKINEPELESYIKEAESLIFNQQSKNIFDAIRDKISGKNRKKGIIRFYNVEKGFGVIDTKDGVSYSFLISNLMSTLEEKDLYFLENKEVVFKEKFNKLSKNFAKSIYII